MSPAAVLRARYGNVLGLVFIALGLERQTLSSMSVAAVPQGGIEMVVSVLIY